MKATIRLFLIALLVLPLVPTADAQGIFGRIRDAAERGAERAVERETQRRADRAVTGIINAAADAVECVVTDEACIEQARSEGRPVVYTDADGNVVDENGQPTTAEAAAAATQRPGEGAWANYDFVPGDRPLFVEDFEGEYVGNVPSRIDFHAGVMEVVSENNNQMLRFGDGSAFAIPLPETLPERFTIEFDLYHGDDWNYTTLATGPLDDGSDYHTFHGDMRNHSAAEFRVGSFFKTGVSAGQSGGESLQNQNAHEQGMVPVRIAVDGQYVKMYIGENRLANIPNADIQRTDRILWAVGGEVGAVDDGSVGPILVDNIRIAAGGRAIVYDQLMAEGRFVTRGILFDTGSSRIRPESTPTLQDIQRALQQHGDLRIRIEGHTDNTGSSATNQTLSQQRAEAVKAWLAGQGIDGSRIEAAGMGDTQPAADNGTPEGRQQNRRVEIVRL